MNYLIEVEATVKSAVGKKPQIITTCTAVAKTGTTGEKLQKQVSLCVDYAIQQALFTKEPEKVRLSVYLTKQSEEKGSSQHGPDSG